MSTGFLLSEALAEALRKPYHQGDMGVTVQYLIEGLAIGEYRVMLKRNFDTACWVPPVGKRDSHSIYYGDRMVSRVIDFFCKQEGIELPTKEVLAGEAKKRLEAAAAKRKAKSAKASPTPTAPVVIKLTLTDILEEKVNWLRAELPPAQWAKLVERLVAAVKSYGRHERQHARHTPRDLKTVSADLKTLGIPFSYFNLFEDARIEHISRNEIGDQFDWLTLEDIAPSDNPFNMLLRCIQLEGAPDLEALESEEPFNADDERTVGVVADSVEGYYKRACECPTAEHLYPVIAEFLREFKEDLPPPPDPEKGKGKDKDKGKKGEPGEPGESGDGSPSEGGDSGEDDYNGAGERAGDLSTAADAAEEGDKFLESFEADTEVVGGTDTAGKDAESKAKAKLKGNGDQPPPEGPGGKAMGTPESIAPTASGGRAAERYFLTDYPGAIDATYRKRVDFLVGELMRMFKTKNLNAYAETEGRRMSGRHLARGEIRYVHKKVMGGKGKRKYTIVFDCSGSMSGQPTREGKLLLLALNELARRGYLEGSLILSGWCEGKPGWLQYQFPVKDALILRINPHHGSEGIQSALKDNLKHIKGMDDVFVYTDANICDAPLDRGYFARQSIWPVGLYAGAEEAARAEMDKHFPQNIIRNTIEQVVATMLTRNKRTVS